MNSYPRTLFYLIDLLCNEKCSKCGHWKYKSQKSVNDSNLLISFINDIDDLKELVFVGGEPLVHKDFILEIIKGVSPDIKSTIITNGVLADKDFIKSLINTNTHIVFSIDTLDKEFWKYVRGQNTYDRVFQNFNFAVNSLKPTQLSVQSVLALETIKHVEEVGKRLVSLGIYHSVQDYVSDGFGGSWTELKNKRIDSHAKCQAHKYNMSIMPNGDIFTCFQQPMIANCDRPLGNIKIDSFSSIINTEYFHQVIESMKTCDLPCKVLKCNIE
ncbi:MAG: radical SAM protein [Acholeplasmataceae bacterium]|nr:radical SAM protein [Acholeplasmataceae bacterium]